jgi:C_GCAxxG_C_C family probable redox protein
MTKSSEAKNKFLNGYGCSQAVFTTFSEQLGIDELTALKVSALFAGGMRIGETCGVVTGALMALGLKFSPDSCQILDNRKVTYKFAEEFYSRFLERHKSLKCKELMGVDISTPEGKAESELKNTHQLVCPAFVHDAAEILEEMLS